MAVKRKSRGARAVAVPVAERWTAAKREAFLNALAETANVAGAARRVGLPEFSPYQLRRKDDAFAAAWDEALEEGYTRLELMLLRRATYGEACDGADAPAISTSFAMALLRHHQAKAKRGAPDLPIKMRDTDLRNQLIEKLSLMNLIGGTND